jgi:hypothetical protein
LTGYPITITKSTIARKRINGMATGMGQRTNAFLAYLSRTIQARADAFSRMRQGNPSYYLPRAEERELEAVYNDFLGFCEARELARTEVDTAPDQPEEDLLQAFLRHLEKRYAADRDAYPQIPLGIEYKTIFKTEMKELEYIILDLRRIIDHQDPL